MIPSSLAAKIVVSVIRLNSDVMVLTTATIELMNSTAVSLSISSFCCTLWCKNVFCTVLKTVSGLLKYYTKQGHFDFYSARNARIASAVLATAIPSVRLSVCLSSGVTRVFGARGQKQ